MSECSEATIESWTRPRRLPCEGFRPNEPERVLAGYVRRLGSVTRLSVEKSPVFFLLFTGRPILLLAAVACVRPVLKSRSVKSGRFWRNEPDGHPSRTQCRLGPNEPNQGPGGGQRAGRTSRDSARMVISEIAKGSRPNDFAIFRKRSQSPQTKPTSKSQTKQCSKMNNTRL